MEEPDAEWLNELPSHSDLELSEDDSDSVSPVPAPGQAQSSSDAAAAGGAPRSGRMLWQVAHSRTVGAAQPSEQWQRLLDAEVAAERTRWQAKIAPTGELYRTRSSPSAAALAPAPVPPMLLSQRSSPSLPRPAVPPPVAEMDEAPAKPLHGSSDEKDAGALQQLGGLPPVQAPTTLPQSLRDSIALNIATQGAFFGKDSIREWRAWADHQEAVLEEFLRRRNLEVRKRSTIQLWNLRIVCHNRRLKNAIARLCARSVGIAFTRWVWYTSATKQARRSSRRIVLRWQRMRLAPAMAKWADERKQAQRMRHVLAKVVARWQQTFLAPAFASWAEKGKHDKRLRNAAGKIIRRWKNKNLATAIERWRDSMQAARLLRSKALKVVSRLANGALFAAWHTWHRSVLLHHKNRTITLKVLRRSSQLHLARCFTRWHENVHAMMAMAVKTYRVVVRWRNQTLASSLDAWHTLAVEEARKRAIMERIIVTMANRLLVGAYVRWCEHTEELRTIAVKSYTVIARWRNMSLSQALLMWRHKAIDSKRKRQLCARICHRIENAHIFGCWNKWIEFVDDRIELRQKMTLALRQGQSVEGNRRQIVFQEWRSVRARYKRADQLERSHNNRIIHRGVLIWSSTAWLTRTSRAMATYVMMEEAAGKLKLATDAWSFHTKNARAFSKKMLKNVFALLRSAAERQKSKFIFEKRVTKRAKDKLQRQLIRHAMQSWDMLVSNASKGRILQTKASRLLITVLQRKCFLKWTRLSMRSKSLKYSWWIVDKKRKRSVLRRAFATFVMTRIRTRARILFRDKKLAQLLISVWNRWLAALHRRRFLPLSRIHCARIKKIVRASFKAWQSKIGMCCSDSMPNDENFIVLNVIALHVMRMTRLILREWQRFLWSNKVMRRKVMSAAKTFYKKGKKLSKRVLADWRFEAEYRLHFKRIDLKRKIDLGGKVLYSFLTAWSVLKEENRALRMEVTAKFQAWNCSQLSFFFHSWYGYRDRVSQFRIECKQASHRRLMSFCLRILLSWRTEIRNQSVVNALLAQDPIVSRSWRVLCCFKQWQMHCAYRVAAGAPFAMLRRLTNTYCLTHVISAWRIHAQKKSCARANVSIFQLHYQLGGALNEWQVAQQTKRMVRLKIKRGAHMCLRFRSKCMSASISAWKSVIFNRRRLQQTDSILHRRRLNKLARIGFNLWLRLQLKQYTRRLAPGEMEIQGNSQLVGVIDEVRNDESDTEPDIDSDSSEADGGTSRGSGNKKGGNGEGGGASGMGHGSVTDSEFKKGSKPQDVERDRAKGSNAANVERGWKLGGSNPGSQLLNRQGGASESARYIELIRTSAAASRAARGSDYVYSSEYFSSLKRPERPDVAMSDALSQGGSPSVEGVFDLCDNVVTAAALERQTDPLQNYHNPPANEASLSLHDVPAVSRWETRLRNLVQTKKLTSRLRRAFAGWLREVKAILSARHLAKLAEFRSARRLFQAIRAMMAERGMLSRLVAFFSSTRCRRLIQRMLTAWKRSVETFTTGHEHFSAETGTRTPRSPHKSIPLMHVGSEGANPDAAADTDAGLVVPFPKPHSEATTEVFEVPVAEVRLSSSFTHGGHAVSQPSFLGGGRKGRSPSQADRLSQIYLSLCPSPQIFPRAEVQN